MILVIGTTGRIGREVLEQLKAKGLSLRVLVASDGQAEALAGAGVTFVVGDLRHPETLEAAFEGVEKLFIVTPGSPELIAAQRYAIERAVNAGVRHVVKISELGAGPDAPLAHLRGNWEIEQQLMASGLSYTIVRPQFFMQNFLFVVAPSVTAEDALYAPISEGRVPFVDLRDVAEVAVSALTEPGHENRVYEVSGPEALSFQEVAERLSEATSRNIRFEEVSPEEAWGSLVRAGLPSWYADDLMALCTLVKAGRACEVTPAVPEVTHHPARPLSDFLFENRDAFQTAYV